MRIHDMMSESQGLQLSQAVLIYEDGTAAAATIHPIKRDPTSQQPAILPGAPVARHEFLKIAEQMAGTPQGAARTLLDPGLLLCDPDLLIWYRRSHRHTMFWKSGRKELDALNGKNALHPSLLFVARSRMLYVYALASSERPHLDSRLFRAPYYNIYLNGHLCEGNIRLPDHYRPDGIPGWERAFFDTNFAHTNLHTAQLTHYPGGHNALWKALSVQAGRNLVKEFQAAWLVALTEEVIGKTGSKKPLTLEKVIQG